MSVHVDITGSLVRFAGELRGAGLGVSSGQLEALLSAFRWLDPTSREHVYHASRATLLTRREDQKLFDQVFERFWGRRSLEPAPQRMPLAPRSKRSPERPPLLHLLAERARSSDPEREVPDRSRAASDEELLRRKDFAALGERELEALRRLFATERWDFVTRVTRRRLRRRRGAELDLRRVTSRAARTGGLLVDLPRRERKLEQRPLVILADVSGSMELYTRVLLQFFHAIARELGRVEVFVFATRLTRITGELALIDVDRALDAVCEQVVDFAGGTRIGESFHVFNTRWARRVLGRGAVVMIVSDGWERGDSEQLRREMRVLRARCHRLIWLNPHLGQRGYEPRVSGMSAALRHVDDFLSCHNLQSLQALGAHLARLPRRRGGVSDLAGKHRFGAIAGEAA